MRQIPFEESRSMMLDILRDVDSFCRKEGIKYTLGEGSLIGAVRHRGMIPWDDDLDILMVREEFDKFCSLYKSDIYTMQKYDYKLNSWLLCVKIIDPRTVVRFNETGDEPFGLWLTVFPIDNAPDDDKDVRKMYRRIKLYMRLFRARNKAWARGCFLRSFLLYPLHILLLPFPKDYWHNKAEKELTHYNGHPTKRRGQFVIWNHMPWICSSSAFDEYIDVDFEGIKCSIMKGYDDYLRCQYGDYMQLPPIEKQVPKHEYTPYWKE